MKSLKSVYFLCLILFVACSKDTAEPTLHQLSQTQKRTISGSNDFGFDLLKEIQNQENADVNVFISPLSISMALGMTLNGAANQTYTEIKNTLSFSDLSEEEVNESYRYLLDKLPDIDDQVTAKIANSIWYNQNNEVLAEFTETNKMFFDAIVEGLDFNEGEKSKEIINNWVSDATEGKIEDLVNQVSPLHLMFLINAVYFLAEWQHPFDKDFTALNSFTLQNGEKKYVDMMGSKEIPFGYFNNEEVQIVNLPYGNGQYQFTVMLPDNDLSIDEFVYNLTSAKWQEWIGSLQTDHGNHLRMPKFEIEYEIKLNKVLTSLGMERAFIEGQADFSRISSIPNIFISKAMHKTFIKVDEDGTEAAAATGFTPTATSIGGPVVVRVNRPFVYFIHEKSTGAILFMGRIMDPSS